VVFLQTRTTRPADFLTDREAEVAEGFARGLTTKQVAREMGIAPSTIRSHLATIFKKLGVKDQTQMVWELRRSQKGAGQAR
jgi:DNA-binding NarL/FixJ family response regulator